MWVYRLFDVETRGFRQGYADHSIWEYRSFGEGMLITQKRYADHSERVCRRYIVRGGGNRRRGSRLYRTVVDEIRDTLGHSSPKRSVSDISVSARKAGEGRSNPADAKADSMEDLEQQLAQQVAFGGTSGVDAFALAVVFA